MSRLLLKCVEYIYSALEPDGIYGSECVSSMIRDDLKHSGESFQDFCVRMLITNLCLIKGISDMALDRLRILAENAMRITNKDQSFDVLPVHFYEYARFSI